MRLADCMIFIASFCCAVAGTYAAAWAIDTKLDDFDKTNALVIAGTTTIVAALRRKGSNS